MYPGGKNSCYQKIINLIPPHSVYIESYLGSGAIMKHKRPAALNFGIEINRAVLCQTADRLQPGNTVIGDGAAVPAKIAVSAKDLTAKNNDVAGGRWYFICADALEFLSRYPFQGYEFVYCDPPYLKSARRSQHDRYEYEYSWADHVALLDLVTALPCYVMISGYESDLYRDRLADWHTHRFKLKTRGNSMATEWLWMNYPEPQALHDYSHLGDDYRERERIKRKKQRWVAGLERMDTLERKAILSAINDSFSLGRHRQI